jgi:hypothetical protein
VQGLALPPSHFFCDGAKHHHKKNAVLIKINQTVTLSNPSRFYMKKKLLYAWICCHLLFIILANTVSTYSSYNEFHHLKPNSATAKGMSDLMNAKFSRYYGRYTGAETGYGFFGINVRSNGMLIGECGGKQLTADFNSYETSLRFFSMTSALTDDFIKPGHQDEAKNIMSELNNLVFKNIAVTMFQKGDGADSTVVLSYNLLSYPTLAAVRTGSLPRYQLIKLITASYSLR